MQLDVQGRRAYAYTGGKPFDATLPCVLFLHGALLDHSVWTLLARWCAHHGHAVLAVDQPGHGRSAGPPLASIEALADWTLALLDAAGAAPATLVGHSMGALVALEAAARAPARIDRLVMLGLACPMTVSTALLDRARDTPLAGIDMVNAFSHSTLAAKPSYPGPGMWLHGGNRALMRRMQAGCTDTNLFLHDFTLCNGYARGLEAGQAVRCATHLVLGRADQMTRPSHSADIAAALKAQVHSVAAGHSMMAEAPGEVLTALRRALSEPRLSPASP